MLKSILWFDIASVVYIMNLLLDLLREDSYFHGDSSKVPPENPPELIG
jgi:hypothetical protein